MKINEIEVKNGEKSKNGTKEDDIIYVASDWQPSSSSSTKGVTIDGKGGSDTIVGSDFDDKLTGGKGNCSIIGASGNDTLIAKEGSNYLDGGEGDDLIKTGKANCSIIGGCGSDTICAGAGTTTVIYDNESESYSWDTYTLTKGGTVNIEGLSEAYFMPDSLNKKDLLVIGEGSNHGSVIKNYLAKAPNATVTLDSENITDVAVLNINEVYEFQDKNGKLVYNYKGSHLKEVIDARVIPTSQMKKGMTIDGGAGNDTIYGSNNKNFGDKLNGGDGNDYFIGTEGNDTICGGAGENTLHYENSTFGGNDTYNMTANEKLNLNLNTYYGGIEQNKNDLVVKNSRTQVTIKNCLNKDIGQTIIVNDENLAETARLKTVGDEVFNPSSGKAANKYTGTILADKIDARNYGASSSSSSKITKGVTIDGNAGNDSIVGSDFADKLIGGKGSDTILGGLGNDTLDGGDGDDVLYGGAGSCSISGGAGDDIIYTNNTNSTDNTTIIGGLGNDSIDVGKGNNTLVYKLGDGNDSINGSLSDTENTIIFEKGTNVSFDFAENDKDVLVGYSGTKKKEEYNNTLTVKNQVGNTSDNDVVDGTLKNLKVGSSNYDVTITNSAANINNQETKTNNVILINTNDEAATEIISNKQSNFVTLKGSSALNYTYNGGVDTVKTNSGNNDKYNVNSFDKKTSLKVSESGGNDELHINANADNVAVVFNVSKGENGSVTIDKSKTIFVDKGALTKDTIKACVSDNEFADVKGITVSDKSATGIEKVTTTDYQTGEKTNSWYNKVAQDVAGWLTDKGYSSVDEAMTAYNSGNKVDIASLVNVYKNVNYSQVQPM